MAKDKLKEYRWICDNIQELEGRLFELETKATGSTSKMSDMPRSGGINDKVSNYAVLMAEVSEMINNQLCLAKKKMLEIEEIIDGLDEREKRLVRLRYIYNLKWEEICVEMNYSWRQIHRLHSDILTKLK